MREPPSEHDTDVSPVTSQVDKIRIVCWILIALYLVAKLILLVRGQPISQWLDITNPTLIGIVCYLSVCVLVLNWSEKEVRNRDSEFARESARFVPVLAQASWSGKEKLWKVFWINSLLIIVTLNAPALWRWPAANGVFWGTIGLFATVFVAVSLWRCAFNTQWRWLGYGARAFSIYVVAGFLYATIADGIGKSAG